MYIVYCSTSSQSNQCPIVYFSNAFPLYIVLSSFSFFSYFVPFLLLFFLLLFLLFSSSSFSSAHPSCLGMSQEAGQVASTYSWQCLDCKTCCVCSDPGGEEEMVFCDRCDRGYHTFCVDMRGIPEGGLVRKYEMYMYMYMYMYISVQCV